MPRGSLRIAIEDFISGFGFGERISNAVTGYIEFLEGEVLDLSKDLSDELGTSKILPNALSPDKSQTLNKKKPAVLVMAITFVIGQVIGVLLGVIEPIVRQVRQTGNQGLPNDIPDIPMLVQIQRRVPNSQLRVFEGAQKNGFSLDWFEDIRNATLRLVNETELVALWKRGKLAEVQLDVELARQAWDLEHIEHLKTLSDIIPPVNDLIQMAVRDAFNPASVARFRLDEDFPADILPHTRAQGLTDDWTLNYWRAHWNLPSPQQAFEMFRRLRPGRTSVPFTQADLQQYLITADVPAFFRERMTAIAYNPLTRVDVRRMFGLGVLDEAGVYEAYLDDGYAPENARRLTEFTIKYEAGNNPDLSREAITKAFLRGLFSAAEAFDELKKALGSDRLASFWMQMALYEQAIEEQDALLEAIRVRYVEGMIDRNTAVAQLGRLNLPAAQQQTLLLKWDTARANKITIPGKGDLEDWYKNDVITAQEFSIGMRERGFRDGDITRFTRRIDQEIQEARQKELERAQKESERLAFSERATQFQIRIAQVDVRIAEKKLAIANIKAALVKATEETDPAELQQDIADLDVEIAQMVVDRARIKTERV